MITETKSNRPSMVIFSIEHNAELMYVFWIELYCLLVKNVQARGDISFGWR